MLGVELDDGRRVVVKAHQPRTGAARLRAVHDVQSALRAAGFPCPEPLLGPVPFGRGHATVETLLDAGEPRDTHDPACRRLVAEALAWQLELTAERGAPEALRGGWSVTEPGRLWPARAHSPLFDLEATAAGAEWIDRLAVVATSASTGPPLEAVVGHGDWSGKHFRFADDAIVAVHDWDSLGVSDEAAIVGTAAMTFTTRFDLPGVSRAPTPEEMEAFLDEYGAVRRGWLPAGVRRRIAARGLLTAAYTARCEHCGVGGYDAEADPDSFTVALRRHGDAYLRA